jgi:UDP-N-acetylmuramate--alanine ligase
VKRRFEYIIKTDEFVFIDDYAHHPEELRALISGAKSLFSDKKCTVIFQPHFTQEQETWLMDLQKCWTWLMK